MAVKTAKLTGAEAAVTGLDGTQRSTVLTSERLLGPYTIVRTGLRPLSMKIGRAHV